MVGGQIRQARDLLTLPGNSISSIARLLGVSRSTIYKYLPELADGHRPTEQIPPSRAGLPTRLAITAPPLTTLTPGSAITTLAEHGRRQRDDHPAGRAWPGQRSARSKHQPDGVDRRYSRR